MSELYQRSNSGDDTGSSSDEGEWLDPSNPGEEEDDEQETVAVISLCDDRVFPDALSMITYCKEKHGLDFLGIRDRLQLDFYGTIKLINFIRQKVHEGAALPADITKADLDDDRYLKPVLDDDALILCLDDLPEPKSAAASGPGTSTTAGESTTADGPQVDLLLQKNAALQAELEQLTKQFSNYRLAVQQTLDQRWQADEDSGDAPTPGSSSASKSPPGKDEKPKDDSAYYFESYAHNDIHEVMLKDAVRTDAYRDFIYHNKDLFAGKVVLDIGCGTGILSMFCAKAGAKQVIAVDNSEIINKARENIFNNGLDGVITCIKGKMEEVILPVKQVDIIVSEWMGYALLYEAMLPSVIYARDKYLDPVNGLLVPSHASIWVAPVADPEFVTDHIDYWQDVYGFNMKAMQDGIYVDARPLVMPKSTICGTSNCFRFLDLHTIKTEDLYFKVDYEVAMQSSSPTDATRLDGFLLWFDMFFARSRNDSTILPTMTADEWLASDAKKKEERVAFTTGPFNTETHWKQILLLIDDKKSTVEVAAAGQDKKIRGEITYGAADGHHRGYDVKVSWAVEGGASQEQTWKLH
ncbi:S-adenosyl-L-methionine-dependent methyltransferase [Rhypophila decipiens]|uniref:type I protein arginine methyltransferase n=1 Tax=Rhypophila decipiens TaxID=261697 RepID=A0AAN7B3A1_9PEZI|nr:S-adenosyl-L-methionine-dependent methyltransferase [Rhypophila decipiens]